MQEVLDGAGHCSCSEKLLSVYGSACQEFNIQNSFPAQEDFLAVVHFQAVLGGDGSGGVSLRAHCVQSCQQRQPPLPACGKTIIQHLGKTSLTCEGVFTSGHNIIGKAPAAPSFCQCSPSLPVFPVQPFRKLGLLGLLSTHGSVAPSPYTSQFQQVRLFPQLCLFLPSFMDEESAYSLKCNWWFRL